MTPKLTLVLVALLQMTTTLTAHHTHCADHPIFTLHNITYSDDTIYSTPAHLAVAGGNFAFNLTNTAVDYTTTCSAYAPDDDWPEFFYGNQIYYCKTQADAGLEASTNFTFSRAGGEIAVNSSWSCGGGNEKIDYVGIGSEAVNLSCNVTEWTNTNWTLGELYSTRETNCLPATLEITPTVSHAVTKHRG